MTRTQLFSKFHSAVLAMIVLMTYVTPTTAAMSDEEFLKLCEYGTGYEIKQALMSGANVNARDKQFGTTALMAAASRSYNGVGVVFDLLSSGADANARDYSGYTALMSAAENNSDGSSGIAIILLNYGANINARNSRGDTALKCAASFNGYPDFFRTLISRGAMVNAQNNDGLTPLMEAARRNRHEVVALLLNAGANRSIRDRFGHDALWHAYESARQGHRDVDPDWTRAERQAEDQRIIQMLQGR